jgi:hypothetical protein
MCVSAARGCGRDARAGRREADRAHLSAKAE